MKNAQDKDVLLWPVNCHGKRQLKWKWIMYLNLTNWHQMIVGLNGRMIPVPPAEVLTAPAGLFQCHSIFAQ